MMLIAQAGMLWLGASYPKPLCSSQLVARWLAQYAAPTYNPVGSGSDIAVDFLKIGLVEPMLWLRDADGGQAVPGDSRVHCLAAKTPDTDTAAAYAISYSSLENLC